MKFAEQEGGRHWRGIRLLTLQPGEHESDICCKLQAVALESAPKYEALSYVWGDANERKSLLLHGHTHSVTANLEAALRHLRYGDEPCTLWIDALCINQDDLEERGAQVEQMGTVFRQADRVISWLGEASDDSDEGMDAIADLEAWIYDNDDDEEFIKDLSNAWSFAEYAKRKQLPRSSVNWAALWRLMERPYFSRVWIVQELAVRSKKQRDRDVVACGGAWVRRWKWDFVLGCLLDLLLKGNWSNLRVPDALEAHADFNDTVSEYIQSPGLAMFGFFSDMDPSNRGESSLEALIQISTKFEATDPRDRIYAMLALTCEDQRGFRPSYTNTLRLVLQEVVEFAVRTSGNLRILLGNRREINPSAPSWAPDLRHINHGTLSIAFLDRLEHFQPDAGRAMNVEFDHSLGIIRARGLKIARVERAMEPVGGRQMWLPLSYRDCGPDYYEVLYDPGELGELVDRYGKDAVARTIAADMEWSGGKTCCPAPDGFADRLGVYLDMQEPPGDAIGLAERLTFTTPFTTSALVASFNHCLFTTECGRLGLGPYAMTSGDEVAVLFGSPFCLILRPVEGSDSSYQLVGDAYLHGAMRGELVRDRPDEDFEFITLC
ncbi:heterokaryon incompatibility protein-domain-containing protein [Cercophora scortea]|uniref:Heterokaryon incompatibility protein-domain-containing protein n=1 Tax=Cercophora scortea TaxID=314031 RepID=A0AAE0MEB6_9PEZI|nr:heterokaryon incompatibility protein-domain-containing protein [Cercophora scortea]